MVLIDNCSWRALCFPWASCAVGLEPAGSCDCDPHKVAELVRLSSHMQGQGRRQQGPQVVEYTVEL